MAKMAGFPKKMLYLCPRYREAMYKDHPNISASFAFRRTKGNPSDYDTCGLLIFQFKG